MPDWTPETNEPGTDNGTGAEQSLSERMAALGRRSGEARRLKRETKAEQSNRDVAEAEIRAMLESSDAKVRREGVRLLSYLEGKKQPQPELEAEPEFEQGPRGVSLSGLLELAREVGIEVATLDDVVMYARAHDLVLRPRRDGEAEQSLAELPLGTTPPPAGFTHPPPAVGPSDSHKISLNGNPS
jgi:hypothetical protein